MLPHVSEHSTSGGNLGADDLIKVAFALRQYYELTWGCRIGLDDGCASHRDCERGDLVRRVAQEAKILVLRSVESPSRSPAAVGPPPPHDGDPVRS